ncbi:MAG: acyl-CoA mutase large subunit family protein [Chloroflexota bacterium]
MAGKTTKEILQEALSGRKRTPLYREAALQQIKAEYQRWRSTVVREQDRENWTVTPHTILGSEVPRELTYTPLNTPQLDYMEDLGFSGEAPFTRGVHPNMYRGRVFTIRQIFGAGSPEQCNQRMKMLLEHGATGANWALDLATVQMFDSDEPESKGQVATVGVPIDCVEDIEAVVKDIPVDKVSASIVTHYPRNTAIIFPMYLVMAERRGISWENLPGSSQNDFIMESLVRSASEYIPPHDDFRIQCDNIEFMRKYVPQWNYVTLNGYNLREWGTSGVTEMAVALANGIDILKEMQRRGHDIDWIAERMAFFWAPANDFFEEVARIRAVRRLWYKIMKYRFQAQKPRSMWMRCHVQTSGVSLFREEPYNNVVRSAYQALAAVLGGVQSMHVDSFDEAYSVPTEASSLLSLRTQQIIEAETQVTQVVDPLAGSFYVEALTDEMENRILNEVDEIERMGGIVAAVTSGWLHNKALRHIEKEQRMIADGEIKVVGVNYFRAPEVKLPDVVVHEYDESIAAEMKAKLERIRRTRNNEEAARNLRALEEACKSGQNVMEYTVACARANVTEGEMRRAFINAFGSWKPPLYA